MAADKPVPPPDAPTVTFSVLARGGLRGDRGSLRGGDRAYVDVGSRSISPVPTSSTASGSGAGVDASMHAECCGPPTTGFGAFRMGAFAERARIELLATGERARKRRSPRERRRSRGGADLAPRGARTYQPRDRRSAVHQSEHE